jgi:hypothetical protein
MEPQRAMEAPKGLAIFWMLTNVDRKSSPSSE